MSGLQAAAANAAFSLFPLRFFGQYIYLYMLYDDSKDIEDIIGPIFNFYLPKLVLKEESNLKVKKINNIITINKYRLPQSCLVMMISSCYFVFLKMFGYHP